MVNCFTVTVDNYVAIVEINRPPVNAQNNEFRTEITTVFDQLGDQEDVRAIILTGAGKTFSAGADLKERPANEAGAYALHNRRVRASFDCVFECKKPVIAAVNGAAIGAGCVLALCCDIIVTADTAFLSMTEVNVGLAGGVSHVRRHFGESNARLMIMTAQRVSGPELVQKNVASHSVPLAELMPLAKNIAEEIASKSPSAVRAAKKSFLTTENLPLHEGYLFEQSQTEILSASKDTKEALAAFKEKRKPLFN
ncbi:enoyl-CoA hydratase/isomerase family protein [Marinomonas balearica]|uniref:Short chain enoyl-CoA hydratase n=1 Tax=Marinomonas balearica TaxID=491947 RepID=A0A4R6MGZ6_9GAMM|nr:enoyl-CoA hydratase/isomerase family protein [Marinomonas balearica]TDP01198.1 short chain enoyl-CoA hydratase [Marinomonas balearica]